MKDLIKEIPATDEFEPIELGSISEETKGVDGGPAESAIFNSQL